MLSYTNWSIDVYSVAKQNLCTCKIPMQAGLWRDQCEVMHVTQSMEVHVAHDYCKLHMYTLKLTIVILFAQPYIFGFQ